MQALRSLWTILLMASLYILAPYAFNILVLLVATGLAHLAQLAGITIPPSFAMSSLYVHIVHSLTSLALCVTYAASKVGLLLRTYRNLRRQWRVLRRTRT